MGHVLINPVMHSHPAFRKLPSRACWSWVASICWLSKHGRVDRFPKTSRHHMDATPKVMKALIAQGLWLDAGPDVLVPQYVESVWSGRTQRLWKFPPLEVPRPKIPDVLRLAVYERDGWRCLHCGTPEALSLDHIFPFSLGGEDTLDNLQTLCRPCNSRKGARV